MITREGLWRRVGSPDAWALAWALAAACAVPWLLPETWDGHAHPGLQATAWFLVAASAPLLRTRWAAIPLALVLAWGTAGRLGRAAGLEATLPAGVLRLEGRVADPWTLRGLRRESLLRLSSPSGLSGLDVPVALPAEGAAGPPPGTPVRVQAELRGVDPAPVFLAERPLWRALSDGYPRRTRLASALALAATGPPAPLWPQGGKARGRRPYEALPLAPGPGRDLWGALALGLPVVDEEAVTPFAESGTLHLLVVSGLQMTLVIAAAEVLLRRLLRRRPRLAACLAAVLGVGYAAAVGFSAPVWRGLLMGLAWILGRSEGWRLPPALTLHGALLLWLLTHPAAGCEPGFLLGWWALLGLLWAAEPLAGLLKPLLGPLALPTARLAAPWLTTLPLVAVFFGGVPVWGAVANLVLLPVIAVLTPLCLLLTLLPLPVLTPMAARALEWTASDLLPVFGGVRPLATAWLGPWLALALAWLALAWTHGRLGRSRALLVATLAASGLLVGFRGTGRAATTLDLEAVDIGQGDALLLRAPDAAATLVDTGPSPWAARRLVKVLSRRGVKEPLRVVLTHPHADHAGGWATLARLWPLEQVSVPDLRDGGAAWTPFAPAGSAPTTLRRGDGWRTGGLVFSARWPPSPLDLEALGDANAVSLVLRAEWRDRQLWLMGDALDIQERDLLALGEPGAFPGPRLLKVGHHGSRSSSTPAWVQALRPSLSLALAGRRNRFGHPHAETLAAFAALGLPPPRVASASRGLRVLAVEGGWRVEGGDGSRAFTPGAAPPAPAGVR